MSHSQEMKSGEQVVPEEGGEMEGETRPWVVQASVAATGANFSLTFQLPLALPPGLQTASAK